MNTINVDLSTGEALNLPIGRQGENNVTQVIFDFSGLKTEFGSGTLSLSVKRPKEYIPYAQTMTVSGNTATWLVNETDTGNFGCGEIQLTYTVSGKVAKTVIYKYTVLRSIGADGEYPIPGQTWQEEMEDEIDEIKQDLQAIIDGESGSGWTEYQQGLLVTILRNALYASDQSDNIDALEESFDVQYTNIVLNQNSISISAIGGTSQLTATTTPSGGSVTWSSSNASVATVSATGLVTATGYGSATITASIGGLTATCSVTISQATLVSISAVYTQSGAVYESTNLNDLKSDLVVTATWNNQTTSTVPSNDYTLSGTLSRGTSTITVSYGGKTTSFNVTVSGESLYTLEDCTNVEWLDRYNNANAPIYLTVSNGNHVKLHASTASGTYYFDGNLSSCATNGINGRNVASTWFSIPANSEVAITINSTTWWSTNTKLYLNNVGNTSFLSGAVEFSLTGAERTNLNNEGTITKTATVSTATDINALVIDAASTQTTDMEFDIQISINGTRYI